MFWCWASKACRKVLFLQVRNGYLALLGTGDEDISLFRRNFPQYSNNREFGYSTRTTTRPKFHRFQGGGQYKFGALVGSGPVVQLVVSLVVVVAPDGFLLVVAVAAMDLLAGQLQPLFLLFLFSLS
jgi:hypothetical protein